MNPVVVAVILLTILGFPTETVAQQRIKGTGETLSLKKFQSKYDYNINQMKLRYGAVGRVSCPFGTASAFLIGKSDVFITSDHLFVRPKRKQKTAVEPIDVFWNFFTQRVVSRFPPAH